ncbi:dehydrogenase [Verrucomicrobia bacterium]|nr:dehydrogenase [Verrucomicrobiota bacterium]
MKRHIALLALVPFWVSASAQQGVEGIKSANLKGADVSLATHHDPASELANFELLPGYQVNLFASEPMFANPIHMMWDSRGRLWVACSWAYPQLKPGEKANDKIIILEDTDNDGKADKSIVFADGLYLPTGIELANGGCYVAQSPDVFFFKDTDGDDVADSKTTALTGFGIEDSHHSISAWRRGPGGWIYFQEGIFLHTQVETQHGVVRNFNGGVYQYNPRTQKLKMFVRGTGGNPWGHVFDRWGQSFMVNNPRIMYLSPGSGNSNQAARVGALISTEKQCGGDLVTGTHLPPEIQGQLLTGRFKSRTVVRYEFIENGAGFSANVLPPLISSKHPNFRPVDCKIGPDGAIYVADWYNSIINHAQHDFRDPRRDHEHGRIWRITHKERPLVQKPKLVGESIVDLLGHLKSPNAWTRHQTRKELSERDPDAVLKATEAWVETLKPTDAGHDGHLVEAMWACQNVERSSELILNRVINAKDGHARSAGARVLRYWHASLPDPVSMIATLAADPFPRTRMEAVLSAGFIPKTEAFTASLNVLDYKQDSFIGTALSQTVNALEPYWQPKLESGELVFSKPEHRDFAGRIGALRFDERLRDFLRNRMPKADEIAAIKALFIVEAKEAQVKTVYRSLTSRRSRLSRESRLALLEGLAEIGRKGGRSLGGRIESLIPNLASQDEAIAAAVAANLGAWNAVDSGDSLIEILNDHSRSDFLRAAASTALGELGETRFREALQELAETGDLRSRYIAVRGLAKADLLSAASATAGILGEDPGDFDPVGLVEVFLRRERGASLLEQELKEGVLHPLVVERVASFHRRTGQLPKSMASVFASGDSRSLSLALLREERVALTADVEERGDPVRGEMIFRRQSSSCAVCHGIGSVGPSIGPNLVAVGAAADTEYIVEAILQPNQSIAEHYENAMFMLHDGTVQTGVITHKSDKEVVIRDSTQAGNEIRIPTDSIRRTKILASLMPDGLVDQLKSRQEFLDLAKFVSRLGRTGPYANDESPVLRKWRVVSEEKPGVIPDEDAFWMPAYSMVNGELPAADLDLGDIVYARGVVEVLAPGAVVFDLNNLKGLSLWIDGQKVEDLSTPFELTQGRKTLTFAIDRKQRGSAGLRVQFAQAPGSSAKFKPEGGI